MQIKSLLADSLQRYQFRRGIELLIVVSCILLLITFQLREVPSYRTKSHLSEAFFLTSTIKQDFTAFFMEHGYWPPAQFIEQKKYTFRGDVVTSIYFDGLGAFHLEISDQFIDNPGNTLSFVAALNPNIPLSNVIWLCGYDKPVEGFVRQSENRTDIPENLLSVACRSIRQL